MIFSKKGKSPRYILWGAVFLIIILAAGLRLQVLITSEINHDGIITLLVSNGVIYDEFWEMCPDTPKPIPAFNQVFLDRNSGLKKFFRVFASPPTSKECLAYYYNPHPPFYFLLLRCYIRLFSSLNRSFLSIPGFVSSLLTLLLFGLLLKEVSSIQSAVLGMLFMAISSAFITMPLSLRTHNIWPVLCLLGMIFVVRYWKADTRKAQVLYALAFGFTAVLSMYTIYFAYKIYIFMLAFALFNGGFLIKQRNKVLLILGISALSALLYYPWLKFMLIHKQAQSMSSWVTRLPFHKQIIYQLTGTFRTVIGYIGMYEVHFESQATKLWGAVIALLVLYCFFSAYKKGILREKIFILAVLCSLACQILVRTFLRMGGWYFLPHYNYFLGLGILGGISIGLKNMRGAVKWIIITFLIFSMLSISVFNISNLFHKEEKGKMRFRAICSMLKEKAADDSLIIMGSNYIGWAGLVLFDLFDTNLNLWIAKRETQLSKLRNQEVDLAPYKQIWYIDHLLWADESGRAESREFQRLIERKKGFPPEIIKARETLPIYYWK